MDLVGIYIALFIKTNLASQISKLDTQEIRTGILKHFGNKGSCAIRFNLYGTSFAFSCGHYASGEGKQDFNSRVDELIGVLNKPLKEGMKDVRLKEHDIGFIFGDLNFRNEIDNYDCRMLIKNKDLGSLLKTDQLINEIKKNPYFKNLQEGPIFFQPTFKYDSNSHEYDTSKKKRVPSWCDRILYLKSERIKLVKYGCVQHFLHSDHRPVFGVYKVSIPMKTRDLSAEIKKRHVPNKVHANFKVSYSPSRDNKLGSNFEINNNFLYNDKPASTKKSNFKNTKETAVKITKNEKSVFFQNINNEFIKNFDNSSLEEKAEEQYIGEIGSNYNLIGKKGGILFA